MRFALSAETVSAELFSCNWVRGAGKVCAKGAR